MSAYIKDQIIGTWKLISWTFSNEKGETIHYLGENATGILMYDKHGNMNAQLMRGNRKSFASHAINGGSKDETYDAFNSYLAYWGKYYEDEPGAVVHIVEGSLFPNWIGNKEVRYGKINGNRLVLNTPPIPTGNTEIVFYITWERVL